MRTPPCPPPCSPPPPAAALDLPLAAALDLVVAETADLLREKGEPVPDIPPEQVFLDGIFPFDSLDLATLIVTLEHKTGRNPFRAGLRQFRTVGELAALYADPPP